MDTRILELTSKDSSSTALKRHVDEITSNINDLEQAEQETALKLVKHLERKRRKQDRIEKKAKYIQENLKKINEYNENPEKYMMKREKAKYTLCEVCKNPRGENCEFKMCRKCCKEKIHGEELECKGHKLKSRKLDNEKPNETQIKTTDE